MLIKNRLKSQGKLLCVAQLHADSPAVGEDGVTAQDIVLCERFQRLACISKNEAQRTILDENLSVALFSSGAESSMHGD